MATHSVVDGIAGAEEVRSESISAGFGDGHEQLILTKGGNARVLLANAITALRFAPEWSGVLGFDLFSFTVVAMKAAPWGLPAQGTSWSDQEDRLTPGWLQHNGIYVSPEVAGQAVQTVAGPGVSSCSELPRRADLGSCSPD